MIIVTQLSLLLIVLVCCVISCLAPASLSSLSYADMWNRSDFDTASVDVSSQVVTLNYSMLCCLDLCPVGHLLCHGD